VAGPFGWPSYVAKASLGLVPVAADGSAHFRVPAGKVVYFQALDKDLNELQRMRSVVQLQPGEKRSCIGCHEDRRSAPTVARKTALRRGADTPVPPPWGAVPFSYEEVVQPVLDRHCSQCHTAQHPKMLDLTGTLDSDRIPASYKTLIRSGLVHHLDYQYNAGGNEKREPLTFGVLHSRLVKTLEAGHNQVRLSPDEWHALKCWIDLNCPLWPDYQFRDDRPGRELATGQ
jgi:mono/diheme cytochrome c family protein